jgi:hypothetical protein
LLDIAAARDYYGWEKNGRTGSMQLSLDPDTRYSQGDSMKRRTLIVAVLSALVLPVRAQNTFTPDEDGFIRNWLVLAPIALSGQSGADEIHYDFLNGEANIRPKADAQVTLRGRAMTWKAHRTPAYFIDFRESFDPAGGEYVAGYAVAYVLADAPMNVTLALSTNDQGKVWLNGKEIFKFEETRVLERDADRVPVSLVQGQNVLVLKVINEVNSWQACARFLRGDLPVTKVKISLTPQ